MDLSLCVALSGHTLGEPHYSGVSSLAASSSGGSVPTNLGTQLVLNP